MGRPGDGLSTQTRCAPRPAAWARCRSGWERKSSVRLAQRQARGSMGWRANWRLLQQQLQGEVTATGLSLSLMLLRLLVLQAVRTWWQVEGPKNHPKVPTRTLWLDRWRTGGHWLETSKGSGKT